MRWINELWRRRVPQGLLLYFGAVWGLVEVTSFLVQRYRLTDNIVDMVGLGALLLSPSVLVWMLRQRPDPDDMLDTRDVVVVGGNALIALGVVFANFGTQAIGRATDTVMVETESGAMETREVPRANLLRSVSIAPARRVDAATTDWLGVGAAQVLQLDLSQNRFIQLSGSENSFDDTGGKDPGDISVPRRQILARKVNAQYFVDGEVQGTPEHVNTRITVYRTDPLQVLATLRSEGLSLMETADELSPGLRNALELPAERAAGAADGPVEALLSDRPDAVAALFHSDYLLSTRRDLTGALAQLQQAIAIDPEFALAGLRMYVLGSAVGNVPELRRGLEVAHANRERFTEDFRCVVRTLHSNFQGQQDLSMRIARGCVEQFPSNTQARTLYAEFLRMLGDDLDGAIQQYEAVLALGPANDSALLSIAQLRERNGDVDGAIDAYGRYLALKPADPTATLALANLEVRAGQRERAFERVLDALARQDEAAQLAGYLAGMHLREGRFDEALEVMEPYVESEAVAERTLALRIEEQVAEARGRIDDALALQQRALALAPPGSEAMVRVARAVHYAGMAPDPEGLLRLDALLLEAFPGYDDVATGSRELMRLLAALRIGAPDDVERGRGALQRMIDTYGRRDLAFLLRVAQARSAQWAGRAQEAAQLYAQAHAEHRRAGGDATLSEFALLRWWLEAAAESGQKSAGDAAMQLLERLQPGYPMSLFARARFAAATGGDGLARELLDRALAAWAQADADYAPALDARALRSRLATDS